MLNEKDYKKALIRMWDSVRRGAEHEGEEYCDGIKCEECPLQPFCCVPGKDIYNAFNIINVIEKWSDEHPQKHKISQLEYNILCIALDHECVEFGNFYILSDILELEAGYFEGATYETNIRDYLKNCEVEDNKK